MRLAGAGKRADLDMEVLVKMRVLGVTGGPERLLLLLVPHGAAPEDRHLGHRARLKLLERAAPGAEEFADKIKLKQAELVVIFMTSRLVNFIIIWSRLTSNNIFSVGFLFLAHLGVLLGGHDHLGGDPDGLLVVDVHVGRVLTRPRRPAPALHAADF